MEKRQGASIMDRFRDLEDPLIERSKRHQLLDIMAIAICAVICGADSWVYVEMFGKSREDWFRTFLDCPTAFPPTTPSATYSPALIRNSCSGVLWSGPSRWRHFCPARWWPSMERRCAVPTTKLPASRRFTWSAPGPLLSLSKGNTLTLGQVKTEEKSNEIAAIPKLLEMLELSGCIVTIDAMGCQKEIARTIVDRGADYLLAVKDNQRQLYQDVSITTTVVVIRYLGIL